MTQTKKQTVATVAAQDITPNGVYTWPQIQNSVCGGMSQRTISNWVANGHFPAPFTMWSRNHLWRGSDLLQWLSGKTQEA